MRNITCTLTFLWACMVGFSAEIETEPISVRYAERISRSVRDINLGNPFLERVVATHVGEFTLIVSMPLNGLDPSTMLAEDGFGVRFGGLTNFWDRNEATVFSAKAGRARFVSSQQHRGKTIPKVQRVSLVWKNDVLKMTLRGRYYFSDSDNSTYGVAPIAGEFLGDESGDVLSAEELTIGMTVEGSGDDTMEVRRAKVLVPLGVAIRTRTVNLHHGPEVAGKVGVVGSFQQSSD